ncbi:MAG: type II toxin-antitoxin system RelE/ParE family toxin [Pyrinomonadaceae bacterium]
MCGNPDFGKLIKGSGGLRKVRWRALGKGKSGGIRVIYYWIVHRDKIIFLDVYSKAEKDDLTVKETKDLRRIIEDLLK